MYDVIWDLPEIKKDLPEVKKGLPEVKKDLPEVILAMLEVPKLLSCSRSTCQLFTMALKPVADCHH